MTKRMRKSSLLVLLSLFMVVVMVGCKSNNENNKPTNTATASPITSNTPEATATPNVSTTPQATQQAAMKSITVEVVDNKGESKVYNIKSDASVLLDALKATEGLTLEGNVGDYGYYVTAVNGVTADFDKDQAYWAFYVNGEYGQTSVDTQPIAEGDSFKLVYEVSKSE